MHNFETTNTEDLYKKSKMVQMLVPEVKNKSINPIQITAEQLIADPNLHQHNTITMPFQTLLGDAELQSYKEKKRIVYEDSLRRQKKLVNKWIEYAQWEMNMKEYRRARSIFERALDVHPYSQPLWSKYAENEIKNKFIDHARNIYERVTTIMPRVPSFWMKYTLMEETLNNYEKCRQIYEKWMSWGPEEKDWNEYLKFERRMREEELYRNVLYRFLEAHPTCKNYVRVAKYEFEKRRAKEARLIFQRCVDDLGVENCNEYFYIKWATFELRNKEMRRAKEVYEFGLANVRKEGIDRLKEAYLKFKSTNSGEEEINKGVIDKRRGYYKELLENNKRDYDLWFDLIFLEENEANEIEINRIAEELLKLKPEVNDIIIWKKYSYLFVYMASLFEISFNDKERGIEILRDVLDLLPIKEYKFSSVWIQLAKAYIRSLDLQNARKILGKSIGVNPNKKVIKFYIELEEKLGNFERCRKLYEKSIEIFTNDPDTWIDFAMFESELEEHERARGIYEKAIDINFISERERVWKAYIDFEIENEDYTKARALYERLLNQTYHIKVFIAYGMFEFDRKNYKKMREIYTKADDYCKEKQEMKEERTFLIENWIQCEEKIGETEYLEKIKKMQPKKIKKQRKVEIRDEEDARDIHKGR